MSNSLFLNRGHDWIKISDISYLYIEKHYYHPDRFQVKACHPGFKEPKEIFYGSKEECKNFVKEIIEKIEQIENNKLVKVEESLKELKEILMYRPKGPIFQEAKEDYDAQQRKQVEKIE